MSSKSLPIISSVLLPALLLVNPVIAEESGLRLTIGNGLGYHDNYLNTEADEKGSWVLKTTPELTATIANNGNTYKLSYAIAHSENFDNSDDTFSDHAFSFKANHHFDRRNAIELRAKYEVLTEERGTGFSEGVNADDLDKPDDYDRTQYGVTYRLGSSSAKARLTLKADQTELDYDSSVDFIGDSRDYATTDYGVKFNYRIGGRTDAVVEYRLADTTYDNVPMQQVGPDLVAVNLDSEERYYLVGLDWDATGKTSGQLRLGTSERDFDDSAKGSDDNFHWELGLSWQPKTYSRLDLDFGRKSYETNGAGDYINSQEYQASWKHAWSGRVTHIVDVGFSDDEYEGSNRRDDVSHYGLKLNYDFREWLDLGFGYRYEERDSNFFGADYERNVVFIDFDIALDYSVSFGL